MKAFTYYQPKTAQQAVGLLDAKWGRTELLAGGTDLHDLQKEYVAQPERIVSLNEVTALRGVEVGNGRAKIGAGTKLAEIAEHADLRRLFPALTTAAGDVGGPQIQNMGTMGGNLCQRNRCWYFRDEHVHCLLKEGGTKCFALDGENRYHAIYTSGHKCVCVNPSTLAPPLIALGATVQVLGPKGAEESDLALFFHAPESPQEREHVLAANQIVVSVTIPDRGLRNASYEVRHKQSYDWPLVQAAAAFRLQNGRAQNVTIVLGHVAPKPLLAQSAAKALEGKVVNEETAAAAGAAVAKNAKPLVQNGYKVKLVEVAVKRAILTAAGQKKYWEA